MKKRTKGRMRRPREDDDLCIGCFCVSYLYDRRSHALDFQSEVDGLVSALEANGYTGIAKAPREHVDALLGQHFQEQPGEDELTRRRAAIARTAIERSWESYHRPAPA
jgi:hypothetical protein